MYNNSSNNFFNNIGNDIRDSLNEGLRTGDFRGLNNAINNSVRSVVNEAAGEIRSEFDRRSSRDFVKTTTGQKPYSTYEEAEEYANMLKERRRAHNEAKRQAEAEREFRREQRRADRRQKKYEMKVRAESLPVPFNPVGKSAGNACVIGGAIGTGLFGVATVKATVGLLFGGLLSSLILPGALFLVSLGVLKYGLVQKGMLERAKKFAILAGDKMYIQISSLAASLGLKADRVQKDVRKMLRKGYFPEGYLDDSGSTLMLSNDVYKQYEDTMKNAESAKKEELRQEALADELMQQALTKLDPSMHDEFTSMAVYGRECIDRLHTLNDDIPGESISRKLDSLEKILREIFNSLLEHPEQMNRMRKLMDYYLPTMIKLVEAYAEYDRISSPGQDILDAKSQIESTLDTINEAFVQLHNNLFQDSVWDVTTDAQVLQTVLKQEGLTKDKTEK